MDDPLMLGEWSLDELAAASLRVRGRLRVRVMGSSMLPALWPHDVLFIRHCPMIAARRGDIVAFIRDRRLFVHRVTELKGESFVTRGDANIDADPEVRAYEFLGKVDRVVRRGKARRPHATRTLAGRAAAALFGRSALAKRFLLRLRPMRSPVRP